MQGGEGYCSCLPMMQLCCSFLLRSEVSREVPPTCGAPHSRRPVRHQRSSQACKRLPMTPKLGFTERCEAEAGHLASATAAADSLQKQQQRQQPGSAAGPQVYVSGHAIGRQLRPAHACGAAAALRCALRPSTHPALAPPVADARQSSSQHDGCSPRDGFVGMSSAAISLHAGRQSII